MTPSTAENQAEKTAAPSWLSTALNLLGIAVVGFYGVRGYDSALPWWVILIAVIALLAWLFAVVCLATGRARLGAPALVVMAVAGAFASVPSSGLATVIVAIGIVRALSSLQWPVWRGAVLTVLAAAIVPLGTLIALTVPITPLGLLAIEAGVAIAALVGVSRRQFRVAETQARVLLEQRLAVREQQTHVDALAERQAVAREIHDLLAHSLGGLVIQLDAVDALLEAANTAGDPLALEAAAARVRDARGLAASGLAEARRAVDALREPDVATPVSGPDLLAALGDLIDAHRSLGGRAEVGVTPSTAGSAPPDVSGESALALRRALQEALTNCRKHAPGDPVSVTFKFDAEEIVLHVENPVSHRPAPGRPGNGLLGMRERFALLAGATVTAETLDGETFVVEARVSGGSRS